MPRIDKYRTESDFRYVVFYPTATTPPRMISSFPTLDQAIAHMQKHGGVYVWDKVTNTTHATP